MYLIAPPLTVCPSPCPPLPLPLPVVKQFQSYVDPEQDAIPTSSSEEEGVALPLGADTLTCNLGVPIMVVCCKVSREGAGPVVIVILSSPHVRSQTQ